MEIVEAMRWRYACKKFDPSQTLEEEKLHALKEVFQLTATSYGLQPLHMLVVQDYKTKETLLPHSFNQNQVVDCSHLLVLCVRTEVDSAYVRDYFQQVEEQRGTDPEILKPFSEQLQSKFDEQQEQVTLEWSIRQCYIALGNLLTACASLRVDSCPMEGFIPDEYDRILKLEEKGLKATLGLPIGYRAADDAFAGFSKVRKPMEEIIDVV